MKLTRMILPVFAALLVVTSSAKADDLNEIDIDSIQDADISILEVSLDIDVDELASKTDDGLMAGDGDELNEAIAACFRRIRYRGHRGWGRGHWGGCYTHYNYCRPVVRSYCYNYCAPVYRCCTPIYRHYWGCF